MTGKYDPTWVRDYYDAQGAGEWDRLVSTPAQRVKLHVHQHYLRKYVPAGSAVLEIGPGPGRFTQLLAELDCRVTAVDISPVQLELHRRYAEQYGFAHAVTERLELDFCDLSAFEDASFDAVVCYGGPLSCVFDKRHDAAGETLRVLRPGGMALFSVMSLWGAMHEWLPEISVLEQDIVAKVVTTGDMTAETDSFGKHYCHLFTSDELRKLLAGCGAKVLEVSASNCLSAAWREKLDDIHADPERWAHLLDLELLACRQPGSANMGTHLIATAQKRPAATGDRS